MQSKFWKWPNSPRLDDAWGWLRHTTKLWPTCTQNNPRLQTQGNNKSGKSQKWKCWGLFVLVVLLQVSVFRVYSFLTCTVEWHEKWWGLNESHPQHIKSSLNLKQSLRVIIIHSSSLNTVKNIMVWSNICIPYDELYDVAHYEVMIHFRDLLTVYV